MRGIAIAQVLVFHFFFWAQAPDSHTPGWIRQMHNYLHRFAGLTWSGVDLFFVLSGFLIGGILLDARASPNYFKAFYARRVFRIFPIYYAWLAAYVLVMALAGRILATRIPGGAAWESWPALAAQLMFLQNFRWLPYGSAIGVNWFRPTWSLAIEEQFYFIAPAVIRFLNRRRLYVFLGLVILSAPLVRSYIHFHLPAQNSDVLGLAYTLMPCRADALAFGVLAALLWRNTRFRVWLSERGFVLVAAVSIFLVGFVALGKWAPAYDSLAEQSVGYTWIAFFYALVLLLVLARPGGWLAAFTRVAWMRELGKVSYCVYLIHSAVGMFCGLFLTGVLQRSVGSWEQIAMGGVAAVVTYGIARLSWAYFENPLLKQGHKYRY